MRKYILFPLPFFMAACSVTHQNTSHAKPVIIGYVGGYRGIADVESVDAVRLSHINYAFVDIKDNRAWLHNEATDTINLRKLVELKQRNPAIKILISIGGWTWSKNFSDATLTDTSRKNFAESAVNIVAAYKLDGIDIDWEYPGMQGDSNVYRPEDKGHYTLLFKELRSGLDELAKRTHQTYFVTTAVGGSYDYIAHTEMDKVAQYCDYINVMSYDYADGSDSISGHHTNLFGSGNDTSRYSADKSIKAFLAAGVPSQKIVIGMAFYGKGWQMATSDNNGLYAKAVGPARGGGFTRIKDSLESKSGFVRYWDEAAQAPYLFNADKKIFISYDDETSVKMKCNYVKDHHLGGAMFWEYSSDKKEYLLKVIANEFGYVSAR
ncbi:MAG TPA: glycoside hydrolase family 18 protein [Panacibacter sp.]|nr:glycoside hydrolase family 18 protein [Panacibacter sp.]HNP46006.1 glycoside hydrolase family 18 protein [Panacibacter sp.]